MIKDCRSEAPKKIRLVVRCRNQNRTKMLAELKYEEAAIIENLTHGCSIVLKRFQHCPIVNAASVLPNPLYPSGHPKAASRSSPVNAPTKSA